LFPNTKVNTLIKKEDLENTLTEAMKGKLDFRTDHTAHIRVAIGKLSFTDPQISLNITNFMEMVMAKRPPTVPGQLFKKILIKPSIGRAWKLHVPFMEPDNKQFFMKNNQL